MAALLLDIATFLITKDLCIADGTDIFRDFTPNKPDRIVVLTEYKGDPANLFDPAVHRSIQVVCRDKDSDAARLKALSIYNCFSLSKDEDCRIAFTPSRWGQLYLRQTPFKLKTDENDRAYYAFNIGVTTTIE